MTKTNNQYTIESIDSIVKKIESLQLRDKHKGLFDFNDLIHEAKEMQIKIYQSCKEEI